MHAKKCKDGCGAPLTGNHCNHCGTTYQPDINGDNNVVINGNNNTVVNVQINGNNNCVSRPEVPQSPDLLQQPACSTDIGDAQGCMMAVLGIIPAALVLALGVALAGIIVSVILTGIFSVGSLIDWAGLGSGIWTFVSSPITISILCIMAIWFLLSTYAVPIDESMRQVAADIKAAWNKKYDTGWNDSRRIVGFKSEVTAIQISRRRPKIEVSDFENIEPVEPQEVEKSYEPYEKPYEVGAASFCLAVFSCLACVPSVVAASSYDRIWVGIFLLISFILVSSILGCMSSQQPTGKAGSALSLACIFLLIGTSIWFA